MRRILRLPLLPVLLLLPLAAAAAGPNAIIRGTLRNATARTVYVGYYASVFDHIFSRITLDSAVVGKGGAYMVPMQLAHGVEFYLKAGEQYVTYKKFIASGDTVTIDYSRSGSRERIDIGGNHGAGNDLLAAYDARFNAGDAEENYHTSFGTMQPAAFAAYLDARRDEELAFVREAFARTSFSDEFRRYLLSEVIYRWAYDRMQYVWKYARVHKEKQDASMWTGYYGFLDTLNFDPLDAPASLTHAEFIREYIQNRYKRWSDSLKAAGIPPDRPLRNRDALTLVAPRLRGAALDVACLWCIDDQMRFVDEVGGLDPAKYGSIISASRSVLAALVKQFADGTSNRRYVSMLNTEVAYRMSLAAGYPAPDIALTDMQGKRFTLASLRGRPVYIDFWATNCPPCVQELKKDARELQKRFGDSVAFVYVSLDASDAAWRKFVRKSGVGGIHVHEPAGLGSALARDWRISMIPRHALIDRDGRLVSADAVGPDHAADIIAPVLAR